MLISFDAISFKRAYIFMNSTYTHTYLRMRNIYALRSHINITKRLCICMYPIKKAWLFDIFPIQMSQGPCTNHVDRIVGNFDLPPLYRNFYLIAVIKCCGNLSNPPPPSFVNVVCTLPLQKENTLGGIHKRRHQSGIGGLAKIDVCRLGGGERRGQVKKRCL